MLRAKKREIRYDSNTDVCRFRYPLGGAISRKKNATIDRENLIVRR